MGVRKRFLVKNQTQATTVAENVQLADTPRARRIGLLAHRSLRAGEGLWIVPTQAVHTIGMRFPIDVIFLDRNRKVRRIYHRLRPFRLTRFVWRASSALEVPAGTAAASGTKVGDELQFKLRND